MSTKIYYAYRIPKNKLNEFTDLVNTATWKVVLDKVDVLTRFVGENDMGIQDRWPLMRERIVRDSKSPERRMFDLNSSFNFWLDVRHAYIVPYGRTVLPKQRPDWIEDFSYWNNIDRPENITARQWRARQKKWDELCLSDKSWNQNRFQHIIGEFCDPYDTYFLDIEIHLGLWGDS